ncbi:MAG: hypothetical protein HY319_25530 [Armatimonadetes bacterium]|nr:hypothetical protein [Armatimonadota bacterium]
MKRLFLVSLAFLLLTASAWGETWRIVAGQGLEGKVVIGTPLSDMDRLFTRTETSSARNMIYWVWYREGLQAHIDKDKVYQLIIATGSANVGGKPVEFVADGGIRIGATLPDIERVYGRNYQSRTLKTASGHPQEIYYVYPPQGIGFVLKAGRLHQIWVWPKSS